jgi:alanyl-tRNA synthetase
MVVQKKESIFQTDLFSSLLQEIKRKSKKSNLISERIIGDHIRAIVFLITAGVSPNNLGRGYVLRRIIRRMIEAAQRISFPESIYKKLIDLIIEQYEVIYPGLKTAGNRVLTVIQAEKKRIEKTSRKGLSELDKLKTKNISGEKAFYLYATHGLSLSQIREKGYNFFEDDFAKAKEEHQKISRQGAERKFGGHGIIKKGIFSEGEKKKIKLHTATHLLQAALRKVLGSSIKQKGSNINEKRLRFDFSFNRKLTTQEITEIEKEVNQNIKNNLSVKHREMLFSEAVKDGALTVVEANYPKRVDVYVIQGKDQKVISKEVCTGPHVESTLELNHFSILKERSIGAGIRRIKAVLD